MCLYTRASARSHARTHTHTKLGLQYPIETFHSRKGKRQVRHLILGRVGKYICIGITNMVFNFPSFA
jgi:hypothetical protein